MIELLVGLFRVVRSIERDIHEEGNIFIPVNVLQRTICGQVREVLVFRKDLFLALVEIVETVAVKKIVIVIINKTSCFSR